MVAWWNALPWPERSRLCAALVGDPAAAASAQPDDVQARIALSLSLLDTGRPPSRPS